MAKSKAVSGKKITGGRYRALRKKKAFERVGEPTLTAIGKKSSVAARNMGGSYKFRLLRAEVVNVYNTKTKKYQVAKIKTVVDNPANRHYVRRNVMTKGTIIETEIGRVRITSRPGQDNTINGILV